MKVGRRRRGASAAPGRGESPVVKSMSARESESPEGSVKCAEGGCSIDLTPPWSTVLGPLALADTAERADTRPLAYAFICYIWSIAPSLLPPRSYRIHPLPPRSFTRHVCRRMFALARTPATPMMAIYYRIIIPLLCTVKNFLGMPHCDESSVPRIPKFAQETNFRKSRSTTELQV